MTWRLDRSAGPVTKVGDGKGYNPYRSSDGKFGAGAHKARPKAGPRTAAAPASAAPKRTRAAAPAKPKAAPRAKFDDSAHRAKIAEHKTAEAHHRTESLRIASEQRAIREKAKALPKSDKAGRAALKEQHAALGAQRNEHRAKATEARNARIGESKSMQSAKAQHIVAQRSGQHAEQAKPATEAAKPKPDPRKEITPQPKVEPHAAKAAEPARPMSTEDKIREHAKRAKEAAEDVDMATAQHHMNEINRLGGHLPGGVFPRDIEHSVNEAQTAMTEFHGKLPVEHGALRSHEYNAMADRFDAALTPAQRAAVSDYSNHADLILNPALRNSQGKPDVNQQMYQGEHAGRARLRRADDPRQVHEVTIGREIHDLDSAIASHHMDHDAVVYRTLADPSGHILGGLQVGSTFTDHGYVSTTANRNFMDTWATKPGRVDMHITLKKGTAAAPMAKQSQFGNEKELLLGRGSKFRVTKIVPATATTPRQVHAEVAND